jgi:hypothetical protein
VQGTVATNFPKNEILDIKKKGNQLYLLSSTSFSKILLSSNHLSFTSVINSLTAKSYRFIQGSLFDIFYILGTPKIYKAGLCFDKNKLFNGSSCDSYNCLDDNCRDCPITPQTCSNCDNGVQDNDYFKCFSSTPSPITLLYPFNLTANTTSNSTLPINNQSNITNNTNNQTSTINSSANISIP